MTEWFVSQVQNNTWASILHQSLSSIFMFNFHIQRFFITVFQYVQICFFSVFFSNYVQLTNAPGRRVPVRHCGCRLAIPQEIKALAVTRHDHVYICLSCLHRCSRSANMEIEWNQMKSRNWRATWMSSKLSMRTLYMFKFRLIAYVTSNPKQEPICQINVARKRMHPSGISLALVQGMSHEWLEFLPNIDPKEEGNPHVATWLPWIPISLQVFPKII
jgi:stage V sporulation protein SpoVS